MAKHLPAPLKQRTRSHVIAAQAVNHIERFIIDEGHTVERISNDYGYDLVIFTYDENGYAERGMIYLQMKSAEHLKSTGDGFAFDIDIRDYNLWNVEEMPVILVLFEASRRRAYWVYVQKYFAENTPRKPGKDAQTVRIRVPRLQVVRRAAIRKMRAYKQRISTQLEGVISHV